MLSSTAHSTNSDAPGLSATAEIMGSPVPRLWTPPLVELTPETSYGYELITFARDVLGTPFDPWQEWLSIHAGELLPDRRPRFRVVLALVARQNGKSTWARAVILYWMFLELASLGAWHEPFILGTSTDRSYAKKFWEKIGALIRANRLLAPELAGIRKTISEECITTTAGVEYGFAANNASAGRSRTIHRALVDEVRQHKTLDAWGAITGAMNAVSHGQVLCISNQGDDTAMLLDTLRVPALDYLETGRGDHRLGIFEWSSPAGSDPTDPLALAWANPNLGRRIDLDTLAGAASRAARAGGVELASFRTEAMCMRVQLLDPAIDPDLWAGLRTETPLDLATVRDRVALCLDISLDGSHATLIAAAEIDGRVHVDVVKAWSGFGCTKALRAELPALVTRVRPRVLGWFPAGPAAALAADMTERRARGWPPRRVKLAELRAETTAVCMALPGLVQTGDIVHAGDPMLDAHVGSAQRLNRGDGYVYQRRGTGPIDGVYALAGAVHLARTLPPAPAPLVVI